MSDAPLTLLAGAVWRGRRGGAARSSLAHEVTTGSVAAITIADLLRQIPGIHVEGLPESVSKITLIADFAIEAPCKERLPVVHDTVVQTRMTGGRWPQTIGVRQELKPSVTLSRINAAARLCRESARRAADPLGDPDIVRVSLLDEAGAIIHQEYRSLRDPKMRVVRHPGKNDVIPERGDELFTARFYDPAAELTRLVATTIRRHVRQAARIAHTASVPSLAAKS